MFSSKSFVVLGLIFRSVIHFTFIFMCGLRKRFNFIHLHVHIHLFQHRLLKRLFFPPIELSRHKAIFFFFLEGVFYYLFLAASGLSCGPQDLRCGAQAPRGSARVSLQLGRVGSVVVSCGLSSCGPRAQQLWHAGLVAPRLVGSQFPDQGSNPCPLHWEVDS